MHAPPIEMELRLLNKEFALLRSRRKITWEGQEIDPTQVALPMEKWTSHLAKTLHIQKAVCLSVAEAREMARRPGKHVYTEGAYSPNSAGAAYVAFGKGTSIAATGRFWVLDATSAYCTEVVALTEALQFLRTYNPDRPGYIYTDCLSVLQALANPQCLDPRIVHMRELIAEISLTRSFRISHVPGHKGIFGNELADFLAWRACRIGAVRQAHLSVRQVKSRLRHWLIDLWNSEWRQLHADTELARWVPDVTNIPSYLPPNRHLTTLLTGHGRFPHYFHRFGLMREPLCPCGKLCPSIEHYYGECKFTASIVDRVQPREALLSGDRAVVLRSTKNRALLILVVTTISAQIPDMTR
ncbi:hypothetical protein MRX96_031868 [Rhipicephalus microplus]